MIINSLYLPEPDMRCMKMEILPISKIVFDHCLHKVKIHLVH